jgi:(R,R)-butanediol dehydrogenase/meso-butanediol dehydrogenase/diacetyl reductase
MKGVVFNGPGLPLSIETLPEPEPGPRDVLIRVHRCGICGSDVLMTSGASMGYPVGAAIGHEYCGEVIALGREVERLHKGDRISAMPIAGCGRCASCVSGRPISCERGFRTMLGGLADYTLVDERWSVRLPGSLTWEDGALVEPMASALRAVRMSRAGPGTKVAVLGAGAMAVGVAYWAERMGTAAIVAIARTRTLERAQLMMSVGASGMFALNQAGEAVPQALGGPPDVVFECTGGPGMITRAIDLVRAGGTVVGVGICPSTDWFEPSTAVYKEIELRFSMAYSYDEFRATMDSFEAGYVSPRAMVEVVIDPREVPLLIEGMRAGMRRGAKVHIDMSRGVR